MDPLIDVKSHSSSECCPRICRRLLACGHGPFSAFSPLGRRFGKDVEVHCPKALPVETLGSVAICDPSSLTPEVCNDKTSQRGFGEKDVSRANLSDLLLCRKPT